MQFNGKLVTILLLGVALGMASFAWWFQFNRGQRALAYWQGENAAVIRHGQRAELLVLQSPAEAPRNETGESLEIDGREYPIAQRVRLDKAPGFVHARHALIDDASYQWELAPPGEIVWSHALVFENEAGRSITVVVALPAGYLRPRQGESALAMDEILRTGLTEFFQEHLESK